MDMVYLFILGLLTGYILSRARFDPGYSRYDVYVTYMDGRSESVSITAKEYMYRSRPRVSRCRLMHKGIVYRKNVMRVEAVKDICNGYN